MKWRRLALAAAATIVIAGTAQAQTRARGTMTYGARITPQGAPAVQNERRVNSRIASRVGGRLSLRVERYALDRRDPSRAFTSTLRSDRVTSTPSSTTAPLSGEAAERVRARARAAAARSAAGLPPEGP